jgi:DNA-binding FadR family transcriptional regulator
LNQPGKIVRIRPLASRKLTGELFEQLATRIRAGELKPGARLPTEYELMEAAGVSRTVVREAVAALRAEGLVVTHQGIGAFVAKDIARAPFRIEPDTTRSLGDLLQVMELRVGVEVQSAGLAAERGTRRSVAAIGAALGRIEQAAARGETAVDQDFAFHRAIAEATGNPQFPRFLDFIGRHIIPRQSVRSLPEQVGGRRAYLALIQSEHERIYDAIRRGDSAGAREGMRLHLSQSIDRYRGLAAVGAARAAEPAAGVMAARARRRRAGTT